MLEPTEVARYRRELAAMVDRAGRDDPEALAQVDQLLYVARESMYLAARRLNAPTVLPSGKSMPGHSWAQIGAALGIGRHAAMKRYRV